MNTKLILLGCAALLVSPVSGKDESPLAKHMELLNDTYKAIRNESDPAKGAALAREAQQAVVQSMLEVPERVAKMPDATAKAKASAEYRKMMGRLFVSLCEMEEAYLAGNIAEVQKIVLSLKEVKKAGHDKFMEEE